MQVAVPVSSARAVSRTHTARAPLGNASFAIAPRRSRWVARAEGKDVAETVAAEPSTTESKDKAAPEIDLSKDIAKFSRETAATFAPRASGATGKNPAVPGSLLYDIFTYQAYIGLAVGGLLSFNLIFPSEKPDIARLLGMWSMWMFTIPSLRARDCSKPEKDALNYLFILVPLINIIIPIFAKSFPLIFTADCIAMAGFYYWKMGPQTKAEGEV